MIHNGYNLIGTTLGRYRIIRRIGQGGHAHVFLAQQEDLSRQVAVKVLLSQVFTDSRTYQDAIARFKREAEVIAQANHENIITIHDYGEQNRLVYLVMPLFSNGSLRDLLERRKKLSLQEALLYLDQAAAALDYAHSHNIVHRDLKPGNFLLDAHGRLVLADFGIAHLIQDSSSTKLTRPDVSLGTPAYMAPEVICPDMLHGEEVDGRADIYALGILLFEMLSGEVPFKEKNTYAVLLQHLSEPLPSLHHMDLTIPVSVDAVLQKATAKSREDRYASAGEFAQAYRSAINSAYPFGSPPSSIGNDPRYDPTVLPFHLPPRPFYAAPTVHSAEAHAVQVSQHSQHQKRIGIPQLGVVILCILLIAVVWVGLILLPAQGASNSPLQGDSCQGMFPPQMYTTPTITPQQAQKLVQQYYCYWNEGAYHSSYNLLGAAYQNQHPWQDPDGPSDFGYKDTIHSNVTYGNVVADNGTFQVWIIDQAAETTGANTYSGYFVVGKDNDDTWKLLEPHLQRTSS
jgi:serine/threonine protein kinase